jgi:hypothetical protein
MIASHGDPHKPFYSRQNSKSLKKNISEQELPGEVKDTGYV